MNTSKLKLFLLLFVIIGQFFIFANAEDIQNNANNGVSAGNEVVFSQKIYPISAIDPTVLSNPSASFYPGLRGSNQMTVYTPAFGMRTGTNEFGSEAIVNGNIVTSLSGADSVIPCDGLVISGHGSAKKWMNENILLGSKIYVNRDSKTLTVYLTSASFIYDAKAKIKETQDIMNYYKQSSYLYDSQKPSVYIDKAQEYLAKAERHPREVQRFSTDAINAANNALANALPYRENELKGVWIRPTETNSLAIEHALNKINEAGIEDVFLETYFHGKTIFPSQTMTNYHFLTQNEKFIGFDPLKVWVEEAHKRGMKVHIWFETFYVGNDNPQDNPKSILAVKPDWGNKTKRDFDSLNPVPSLSEHSGYFLDPANPQVQEFLQCLIIEIVQNYHPDGINLDYIRYPQSMAAKYAGYDLSNWGYTEYARNEFKSQYTKDPVDIAYSDPLWASWARYRQDKITSFVSRISCITKSNKTMLTAVIFPDRQKAMEVKQQDWRTWSALNYVDGFTPLLLTCDPETASVMLQDVIKNKSDCTKLYAGLFITFMNGTNEDLLRQIHEARKLNANGVIVFDYSHLKEKYVETLTVSVFDSGQATAKLQCNTPEPKKHHRRFFVGKYRG
jgi:uncharacterized lipoprotein YddW (UPF0748 family)